ncbi:MAG: hypothetical protein RJB01_134 [Actinomycetota bacterium]|jgi:LacI family transcriptional regulator
MTRRHHPHPLQEIANQARVSLATVDRALNGRGGVRPSTMAAINAAIADLDRQHFVSRLQGSTVTIDLIMDAPPRFSSEVIRACEAQLSTFAPGRLRLRPYVQSDGDITALTRVISNAISHNSNAIIIKAPDLPEITESLRVALDAHVPVITLVTDLPNIDRVAYIGIDNRAAGRTAAYLIDQWCPDANVPVLLSLSSDSFAGEEEREMGFRSALRGSGRTIFDISETRGLDEGVAHAAALLQWTATDVCVYSIGGGNRSLLQALDEAGVQCHTFIAHDLDSENRELLTNRRISAVVHHDLARDMHQAVSVVLQENGLAAPTPVERSPLWVITPENIPPSGF